MADEVARGVRAGARPTATGASSTSSPQLYRLEMRDFIDRNIDSPLSLLRPSTWPGWPRSAASGGCAPKVGAVPQGRRGPGGSSRSRRCTPASRRTTRSRSTRSSPTWTPSPACSSRAAACTPCRGRWPARRRSTASSIRYGETVTRVETARRPRGRGAHADRRAGARRRGGAQPRPAGRAALLLGDAAAAAADATRRRASCCWPGRPRRTPTHAHHTIHFGTGLAASLRRDPRRPADERPVVAGHDADRVRPVAGAGRPVDRTTCCSRRRTSTRAARLAARWARATATQVVATLEARG